MSPEPCEDALTAFMAMAETMNRGDETWGVKQSEKTQRAMISGSVE